MTTEPEGPYRVVSVNSFFRIQGPDGRGYGDAYFKSDAGLLRLTEKLNVAFAFGRASRDGLRMALERLGYAASGIDAEIINKALADDD